MQNRIAIPVLLLALALPAFGQPYYVAPAGSDTNPGTVERPFASLQRAQQAVRQKPRNVFLRGGTYYLPETLGFTAADSGTADAPVSYQAYQNEKPVISGGVKLEQLNWQPFQDGIFQAKVPVDLRTEEIFVNGERKILARYPNFDPSAQALTASPPTRSLRIAPPAGLTDPAAIFHAPVALGRFHLASPARHNGERDPRRRLAEQPAVVHRNDRFVENIRGTDARRMVVLDSKSNARYFYPPPDWISPMP